MEEKVERLGKLNVLLDMDKKDPIIVEEEPVEEEVKPERKKNARERQEMRYWETDAVIHSLVKMYK